MSGLDLGEGDFVPMAEAMPGMVWLSDHQGKCVYLNKALRAFWGVAADELPRFDWTQTLRSEDREPLFLAVSEAIKARAPFLVRARYRRHDGAERCLETRGEPRFAPNGAFLGMVGVNTDVTDA